MSERIMKGRASTAEREALLSRITPTADYAALDGCDLVIEAVFEDRAVKAEATERAEAHLGPDAVFASNTSTLPITSLAEASGRPENFIGIHFFSPVEKMMLVEIILGKKTCPSALARALDYVRAVRKTPIVVNDSRGFYTSRVVGTYIGEGISMLAEGIPAAMVENVGRMAGMPVGPLSLNDEVALDLAWKIAQAAKKDLGAAYVETPRDRILEELVVKRGRLGRKNRELRRRFLVIQALETARCFEENVLTDVRDADVGAILGFGYAPFTGGPLSYIDGMGAKAFVALCEDLASRHGARFEPNALLRDMAARNETFYGRFAPEKRRQAA
jgi:3-hydroxyacyl-CoA dehydrogenase/enoyl-CoA hydratase/3-hydroxybutyryl-CoA epimerase